MVLQPTLTSEQALFWRDPALQNIELLRATYITHSFARHTHDSYAIGVIDSGVEEFTYRGATHRALPNNIVIVQPGEVHNGHAGSPGGWQYRMFYPDVALLQQALAELDSSLHHIPFFPNPVVQDEALAHQLRQLHVALEQSTLQLERDSRFLWSFAQLILRHADRPPVVGPFRSEDWAVQKAVDYLHRHLDQNISLEQLASLTQLKPLRLLRVFQRQLGLPPHAYLVQLRVSRAKELLAQGVAIAQVAFDTGFSDQSHLNRHFKRVVGITPKQYVSGCCHG